MTSYNDDDRDFERWLERNAPALNAPPAAPREEMWQEIQAALRAAPAADDTLRTRRESRWAIALRRGAQRPGLWAWPTALAAALVLGVVLDRTVIDRARPQGTRPTVRTTPTVASNEGANGPKTSGSTVASSDVKPDTRTDRATRPASPAGEHRGDDRGAHHLDAAPLYRLAAQQTLGQAEALLTTYRASDLQTTDPESARRLGSWARDVLTSTRLLLDSPAASDPELDALLNDLELVLVQIVQLSGAPLQSEDRALIERAMREHDLLPRLRTAVPAGTAAAASDD